MNAKERQRIADNSRERFRYSDPEDLHLDDADDDYGQEEDYGDASIRFDDGEAEEEDDSSDMLGDQENFEILSPEAIFNRMYKDVQETSDMLQTSFTISRLLLSFMKWYKQDLINLFYDNRRKLFKDAQIADPFSGQKQQVVAFKDNASCGICFESLTNGNSASTVCGHNFCSDCWMGYLADKVSTFGMDRFQCPATDCPALIEDIFGISLVESNSRIVAKYQKAVSEVFVETTKYLRWCPGPNCSSAIRDRTHGALTGVNCSECHHTFCCSCGQEWHDPVCCRLLKMWKQKAAEDVATSEWLIQHSKPCPQCAMAIEKNGGCNHMTCRRCHNEFCWICLGTWSPHDAARCSTYSASAANKGANQESQALIKRYVFHQDRFKAYQESLRLEQALQPQVENKVERMKALEMNRFEAETPRQAWETLLKCRRTLMWTFVFAYFLKDENEQVIFEGNQNAMQRAVEDLSGYLQNKEITEDNVVQYKRELMEKAKFCDSRQRKLVRHIQEGYESDSWKFSIC